MSGEDVMGTHVSVVCTCSMTSSVITGMTYYLNGTAVSQDFHFIGGDLNHTSVGFLTLNISKDLYGQELYCVALFRNGSQTAPSNITLSYQVNRNGRGLS